MRVRPSLLLTPLLWPALAARAEWPLPRTTPEEQKVDSGPLWGMHAAIQALVYQGEIPGAVVAVGVLGGG
jgi:hypothetical protein